MRVICIEEDSTCNGGITKGHTYDIYHIKNITPNSRSSQYCIIDNTGNARWYSKRYLNLLSDYRENKLNRIFEE